MYEFEEEKLFMLRSEKMKKIILSWNNDFLKRFSADFREFQSKLTKNGVATCIVNITGYVWFRFICRRNTATLLLMSHYLLTVLLVILFLAVP
jgi:hypothetical protein